MWRHCLKGRLKGLGEWLKGLGERHTVVPCDERGCGLSDAEIGDPSVEVWVGVGY